MRSSRGKAPLRMTPVASDEILTPAKKRRLRKITLLNGGIHLMIFSDKIIE
jgi:hypothetical protein